MSIMGETTCRSHLWTSFQASLTACDSDHGFGTPQLRYPIAALALERTTRLVRTPPQNLTNSIAFSSLHWYHGADIHSPLFVWWVCRAMAYSCCG